MSRSPLVSSQPRVPFYNTIFLFCRKHASKKRLLSEDDVNLLIIINNSIQAVRFNSRSIPIETTSITISKFINIHSVGNKQPITLFCRFYCNRIIQIKLMSIFNNGFQFRHIIFHHIMRNLGIA